jgi:putative ABC transport system permease protein
VAHHLIRDHYVQVEAQLAAGGSIDRAQSLISADRDTARSVAESGAEISVPGVAQPVPYFGYRGDASWIGYALIHGRWFSRPGEVVAPTQFLRQSGLHVGDTFTAVTRPSGGLVRLTVVGEILDVQGDDVLLRGDWSAVAAAEPKAQLDSFEIALRPGADVEAYVRRLVDAGGGTLQADTIDLSDTNNNFVLLQTVVAGLGVVLTAIAVAGVFNTVVLTTRERVRDVAILKAIGMGPAQVVAMVVASVAALGVAAGVAGVPLGLLLHAQVLVLMAQTASGTGIPPSFVDVIAHWQLPLLGLAGVGVAAVGAWLPARWAAGGPVAEVLQAE